MTGVIVSSNADDDKLISSGDCEANGESNHNPHDKNEFSPADMAKQMQALQSGGPMVQARNFAVMTGVNAGLAAACKLYRGKDDIYGT